MDEFYINCETWRDDILYRGVKNGKRFSKQDKFRPKVYLQSKSPDAKFRSIEGLPLDPIEFSGLKEAKDFVRKYEEVENFFYYGNTTFQYAYLYAKFGNRPIKYDLSKLVIAFLDIEVSAEHGFVEPGVASAPVIAITVKINTQGKELYFSFGLGPFKPNSPNIAYKRCNNESELLTSFLNFWFRIEPDIVSGWNVALYDIPYLVTRCTKVLGEDAASKLSPWRHITSRVVRIKGQKEYSSYTLYGISILDYMELYKRFHPQGKSQESYSLNNIAMVELGEQKESYAEFGSLHQFYVSNHQKFIEYNIRDVALVDKLDKKNKLISMVADIAYDSKTNFEDVFYQVRIWDVIVTNHLQEKGIIVPRRRKRVKESTYSGAYVSFPQLGKHKWVVSYDVNALYPSVMAALNISNDTLLPEHYRTVDVNKLAAGQNDLKLNGVRLAANGHCFSTEKLGFFPEILERMYKTRVQAKQMEAEKREALEVIDAELIKRGIHVKD